MTGCNVSQFVICQSEDGQIKLDVRFVDETVWLTQQQLAELFQTSRTNVVEHIQHIYEEGELDAAATCREFRQVRTEGTREVACNMAFDNPDMTLSVGYRVKNAVATVKESLTAQLVPRCVVNSLIVNCEATAGKCPVVHMRVQKQNQWSTRLG